MKEPRVGFVCASGATNKGVTSRLQHTSPEAGFGLLVHFPDCSVLDGEHTEAVRVFLQKGLICVA